MHELGSLRSLRASGGNQAMKGGKHTPGVEEKQTQKPCCNTDDVQRLERKFGGSSGVA